MAKLPGFVCGGMFVAALSAAPPSVQLLTNKQSPQPVGTPIGLTARVESTGPPPSGPPVGPPPLGFRYSVSVDGGPFRILRDFSQARDFVWAPALYEHEAKVRVSVRDNKTSETADSEQTFRIVSRVKGGAVVTPTAHPLVPLFSAPPCPADTQFRVAFRREGDEDLSHTPAQPCRANLSNNVYVAGLRADTKYHFRSELVNDKGVTTGAWLPFRTGLVDGDFPPVSVPVARADRSPHPQPLLVHSALKLEGGSRPFATNLSGDIVWYSLSPQFLVRVLPGGRFLAHADGLNSANMIQREQLLREFDLAGYTLRETNIARVAEQLVKYGINSDCRKGGKQCVTSFHHEAVRLPNGHTLTIAGLEQMFPAGTQGAKDVIDIVGDLVIELDEDFQVVGAWNAFDHVDISRAAPPQDICREGPGFGGCPPIFLAAQAREWLHSNALNFIPESGDFLISMPTRSWVAKIDWKHGKGSGKVLWRLGEDGDFKAISDDPHPWFSFQHDSGFDPPGSNIITLFDNGHARNAKDKKSSSRGQAWRIDEQARTATLIHNADLGVYAFAVGSAQTLKNGGYSFQAGFINVASNFTRAIETSKDGRIVYAQQLDGVVEYRSFRVADMYSGTGK
jgi:hypothetical protein